MIAYEIRAMQPDDLPAVNRILSKSFTAARINEGFKRPHVPLVHQSFLEMYLAAFPPGCYVMEHKHTLIGYSFAHLWGKVGWIGPVSIIPAYQGKHLGREIVQATVQALQNADARVIGLETVPRNYRNLGFYSNLGFLPGPLSLDLVRHVPPVRAETLPDHVEALFHSELTSNEHAKIFAEAEALARAIDPNLWLQSEIALIRQFQYGDVLYVRDNRRLIACVVAHTETYSPEETARPLKIIMLLVHPQQNALLPDLLPLLFRWAERKQLTSISVRTPTRYQRAYRTLIDAGFRVAHAELRMTLEGYHEQAHPDHCNLMKWE